MVGKAEAESGDGLNRSPKGKARYHHGNLRRELIAAGVDAVGEQGAGALTLRGVARRAGVSHTAIYHHFDDKEALLAAVAEEAYRELTKRMKSAASRVGADPIRRIHAFARAYVRFAADRPVYFKVMGEPEMHRGVGERGNLREAHDEALGGLANAVADAQAAGSLAGDDPRKLAISFWMLVHGYAESHRTGRGLFVDRPGARLTSAILDGSLTPVVDQMLRGAARE